MDEPLGALDSEFRRLMCGELRELHDRIDATSIYVTHDQLEAMAMADSIAVMNKGRVEQIGTPQEIYDCPQRMFVADFIGAPPMSFLDVHGPRCDAGDRAIWVDGAEWRCRELFEDRAERRFALGVRPENVSFADSSALRGQVIGAEYLGTTQIVTVTTAMGSQGAGAVGKDGSAPARPSVCRFGRTGSRCSTRRAAGAARGAARGGLMAEVVLLDVSKRFGAVEAVRDLSLVGRRRRVRGAARADRRRQDHDAAPDRRAGAAGGGRRDDRRTRCDQERAAERDVAFVFQQYSLYPHLTVYDNLAFPLRSPARRMDEALVRRRVQQVAEMLHIEQKLDNRATALSGGEMQRVAIGRALVREPAVYLMDEPLSSLDAKLRSELRLELKRIQRELGATILYVTHDQVEAMTMADRIGVMNEGVLIQQGTPREIYERPTSTYVASRLGAPAINLIPAELVGGALPPQARTVGLRTEHIRIFVSDCAGPRARVHWVEHLGDQNHVHLKLDTHALVTMADPEQDLKAGDEVSLEFAAPLYFDQAGNRIGEVGA